MAKPKESATCFAKKIRGEELKELQIYADSAVFFIVKNRGEPRIQACFKCAVPLLDDHDLWRYDVLKRYPSVILYASSVNNLVKLVLLSHTGDWVTINPLVHQIVDKSYHAMIVVKTFNADQQFR